MTQHLDLKQSKLLSSCDQSRDTTPTTPEESNYSLTNFGQIPRSSSVRIEDKLFQKQVGANRRLEELRKKLETEEMQKLQEKPKISKRTKELAKKADLRYFEQLFTMNIENNQQFECEDIENLQRKNTQKEKIVENNCIKPIKIERSRKSVAFIEQNQTQNPTKSLHLNTEVTTRKESPELSPIRYEIKPLRKQKRKRQSLLDLSAADRSKV